MQYKNFIWCFQGICYGFSQRHTLKAKMKEKKCQAYGVHGPGAVFQELIGGFERRRREYIEMQVFHMVFASFGHKHAIMGGYNWRGVHGPGAAFQVPIEIFWRRGK